MLDLHEDRFIDNHRVASFRGDQGVGAGLVDAPQDSAGVFLHLCHEAIREEALTAIAGSLKVVLDVLGCLAQIQGLELVARDTRPRCLDGSSPPRT